MVSKSAHEQLRGHRINWHVVRRGEERRGENRERASALTTTSNMRDLCSTHNDLSL